MALHFELVSPERLLFSGEVAEVDIPAPTATWYPAGHAPVLSTLRPGVVTITKEGGAKERIFVRGGFAEVNPQGLTLLAEVAVPIAELDARGCAGSQGCAEDVSDAQDDETRRRAQENLDHLLALQSAL